MELDECAWKELFDDSERKSLKTGYFLTGTLSIVFGFWISLAIILTHLYQDSSYRILANFTTVACFRRVVPLVSFFNFIGCANFDFKSCEFFAFLETFLAVLEVEWLTHVCIERYIVAKYAINGWPSQKYHYTLFQYFCLFFASSYSFPPLMGFGRYSLDFSCFFCTFDVILQDSWQRYVVVVIFLLRSIKPAIVMLMMLIWARIVERKLVCSEDTQNQVNLTKNVIIVTLVNQICWSPIALIRGGVIVSQFLYANPIVLTPAYYVKWALWLHWMAPALTALTLFTVDYKLRDIMLKIYSNKATDETNEKNNKEE